MWYRVNGGGNYNDAAASSVTATIGKKAATVTANAQTVDLNGAIDTAVANAVLSGAVSGHTLTAVTLTGSSTANATTSGTITPSGAKISSGGTDVTANYEITYVNGALTVRAGASGVTAPAANTLTYSGAAQELVTAGTATGGTMQYALGTDGTTAPASGWGTAIPTGTDAGTYYVWYRVTGGGNYNDVSASSVTVTIGKKTATVTANNQTVALNGTIDTAVSNAHLSGAVSGHTLSAVTLTGSSTANATTSGTITPSEAKIFSGGTDVTDNYEITYVNGVLSVRSGTPSVTAKADLNLALSFVDRSNPNITRNRWPYRGTPGTPKLTVERADASLLSRLASLFAAGDNTVTDYGMTTYSYRERTAAEYQPYSEETLETLPVGEYTLRVEIAESRNYYAASAETNFNIVKAEHDDVEIGPVKVQNNGTDLSMNLSACLEEGAVCSVSEFNGMVSGTPTVSGSILSKCRNSI